MYVHHKKKFQFKLLNNFSFNIDFLLEWLRLLIYFYSMILYSIKNTYNFGNKNKLTF